jgi:hypothetical protein
LTGAHDIGASRNARLTADSSITAGDALDGRLLRTIRDFASAMYRIALPRRACNG